MFLNPELSIEDIAHTLKTNKTYVSKVLNEDYGKSFYSFINEFRVFEAQRLLKDASHDHFSLDGIASLSGFNSRFVLSSAFKKITGTSPSAFRTSAE
jgi:YesN/AraC family two-component response regulator